MIGPRMVALLTLLALGIAAPARAEDACTNAMLTGDFGFSIAGNNLVSSVQFAFVGSFKADGAGAFTGSGLSSVSGAMQRLDFTGNYTVQEKCVGTATLSFRPGLVITLEFVLVDGGREAYVLVADKGTVEFGTIKRLAAPAPAAAASRTN
jgi:hypothetical protein